MLTETETYEDQRARAWYHKQQLEGLPTFSNKLKYWLDEIGSYPFDTRYEQGENAPFTLAICPKTDEDRGELHRVWMDHHRKEMIEEKEAINKFGWQWSETDKKGIAFYVQSVDALTSDLELRLSTALRKKDLLYTELASTTADIDMAIRTVNGYSLPLADIVNELRYDLETNRSYDFAFTNDLFPSIKAVQVAQVWDIVHYESDLKDRLEKLQNQSSPIQSEIPPITTSAATHYNEATPPTISVPQAGVDTFDNLFVNSDDVNECVGVLQEIEPPVLSLSGRWIGGKGSKSVIVAFIDRLEQVGKIKKALTRKQLVALLNIYFPGLNMGKDARLFGVKTSIYDQYKSQFDSLILPSLHRASSAR